MLLLLEGIAKMCSNETVNVGRTLYREKIVLNAQCELKRCARCFCFWKMLRYIKSLAPQFLSIT